MVDVLLEVAGTTPLPGVDEGAVGLSEKDVCILALVDSLPLMEVKLMRRRLDPAAQLLDVSRAEVAVRWWGDGGRDKVVLGKEQGVEGIRPRF